MKQLLRNKMLQRAVLLSLLYVVGSCLFVAQPLLAQVAGTGSIQGTVSDPAGNVIQGASVKATNTATGLSTATNTTRAGFYVLPALQPGEYTVEFNANGFALLRQEHVNVDPIAVVGLNATLKVGSTTVQVTVTTAPPALNTENGTMDTVIPAESYADLPVAMNSAPKSPLNFAMLLPGASATLGQGGSLANTTSYGYTMNGSIQGATRLYVNGMPIIDPVISGATGDVNADSNPEEVASFQAVREGTPAYYGGPSAINLVTKSGTNTIHGDVYENVRNNAFDDPGYFAQNQKVELERQNEYGASGGGPILKNRLFAFFNADFFKIANAGISSLVTIPTDAMRNGDFSQPGLPPIYDPATTSCSGTPVVCTRQQFSYNGVLNVIPPDRISNVSKVIESALPPASNSNLQANYVSSLPTGSYVHQYYGRMDGKINDRNQAYFMVQQGTGTYLASAALPEPYSLSSNSVSDNWNWQAGETWAIKSNLVNLFSAQYTRSVSEGTNSSIVPGKSWPQEAGLTGMPPGAPSVEFPSIGFNYTSIVSGNQGTLLNWGSGSPSANANNMLTFQDNVQWTKGKHSLTVGGSYSQEQQNNLSNNSADFNFNSAETAGFAAGTNGLDTTEGNPYASYLLGLVDGAGANVTSVPAVSGRWSDYGMYAQDDWKLTPKLTLNLGLRDVIAKPYTEAHNHSSWFDPTLPNPLVDGFPGMLEFAGNGPGTCNCSTQVATHYLEFDPRIGFAYALNPKTAIRGSYTINHFLDGVLGGSDILEIEGGLHEGYATASPQFITGDSGIDPAFNWNSGLPAYTVPSGVNPESGTGAYSVSGGQPVLGGLAAPWNQNAAAAQQPYYENWTFTVSRELSPSVVWQISYIGNESHQLPTNELWSTDSAIDPKYLALGNLLNAQTTDTVAVNGVSWATELAQAQATFPGIGLPYANFQGNMYFMLLNVPQYFIVENPGAHGADAHYESMETSVQKSMSNGLYFQASYVWSKNIDDTAAGTFALISANPRTPWNLGLDRSVSTFDIPNAIKAMWVYKLPVGRGYRFGGQNDLTDALLGGWQISGDNTYQSGIPLVSVESTCTLPEYAQNCYDDYNPNFHGSVRINGKWGAGDAPNIQHLDPAAFQPAKPYTFGTTPRTMAFRGLRNPWYFNEDVDVAKDFKFAERYSLRLQVDAFNLFNRTDFGGISTNTTPNGPNGTYAPGGFGYVTNQANTPRELQFEVYLKF